ncbi:MAG: hypothetical protein HS127_07185 [Planctomycetia bacterium]|nr:hypothetical protein [Planctomycetia bacterium]
MEEQIGRCTIDLKTFRNDRYVCDKPLANIPQACGSVSATKAAYRFP